MPSIPTVGSFDPPESTADEDTLAAEAEALEANSGRIVGSGDNLVSDMRSTAVDFSEIVSDRLQQEAGNSTGAYLAAMQGAAWGAMVTGKWASDVKTYKTRREELIEEWEEAVGDDFGVDRAALGSEIGGDSPSMTADAIDRAVQNAVAEAGQAKLTEMEGEADTAYEEYKDNAAEAGRMLTAGPSPEDLRILTGGGAASWMAFNLWGTDAALPVTGSDGRDLGEALAEAMAAGDELTPELRAQLEMVYAIAERAQEFQGIDGAELSAGELEFLEAFYDHMDSVDGRDPYAGGFNPANSPLYSVGDWAANSENMSEEDKRLLLSALGGGILALSNESVGGGLDRLPDNVRVTLDNQHGDAPGELLWPDHAAVLGGLSPLFGNVLDDAALSELEGGREFSAALTVALAEHFNPDNSINTATDLESDSGNLLGVSTRNHEANTDVLTGDYQHSQYGDDSPEFVLRSLFGHDWEDGGTAASLLTDWIPEAMYGDDPHEEELAALAAHSLYTTMTNEDPAAGGHWDQSAFEFFTDGYGQIGADEAASLGVANPEIARSLGDVVFSTIPYFAEGPPDSDDEFSWGPEPEDRHLPLDIRTRASMFELVMADEQAANDLGGRVYALAIGTADGLHEWSHGEAGRFGAEAGRLIGLLDAGYANLAGDVGEGVEGRNSDITATDARHAAWARAGSSIVKEVGGEFAGEIRDKVPGLKTLGTLGKVVIKEIFEAPKWAIPLGQTEGWWLNSDPGSVELAAEFQMTRSDMTRAMADNAVTGMLADPASGVTTADVRAAAEAAGQDPGVVLDGDRLKDLEEIPSHLRDEAEGIYVDVMNGANSDYREMYENYTVEMELERADIRRLAAAQ